MPEVYIFEILSLSLKYSIKKMKMKWRECCVLNSKIYIWWILILIVIRHKYSSQQRRFLCVFCCCCWCKKKTSFFLIIISISHLISLFFHFKINIYNEKKKIIIIRKFYLLTCLLIRNLIYLPIKIKTENKKKKKKK